MTARLFECTFILVGIVAMLGIITLRQPAAGAAEGTVAYTLAAIKDWTFLLGPGWIVGWGNGLMLGYLMHSLQAILTIPEFAWELFLGVYCAIWARSGGGLSHGFHTSDWRKLRMTRPG